MKALIIYLKARLSGENISWTTARFRALNFNTAVFVDRKLDEVQQYFAHKLDAVKAFFSETSRVLIYGAGFVAVKLFRGVEYFLLGRCIISLFRKSKVDLNYIFD